MVDAIIYRGPSQTGDSSLLKNSQLGSLDLSGVDISRPSFNDVYSNVILEEESDAGQGLTAPENLSPAAAAFLAYMTKTPEELYFEQILKDKGITPEQYEMLPQKEKAELTREVMEEVRLRMEEDAAKKAAGKEV
ncbi:hypothetical protein NUH88_20265 [Nisaea acidiphila]|uniref:Uncharacterized protein n=1 Tax=Nisaea acidiphila TaxID=1862145 RepID=A0A9J7AQQ2_9PROT|nr:hypothetical protein [Nisaea acidiphila]UUX49720.1 hypothetical protein NUH88_20265 [Nisaea acidiphila]